MAGLVLKVRNISINMLTVLANIFIWRDKKIWLFGSWMGERFADNSRFLFQYLHENKQRYGIKRVIWVTRNSGIFLELYKMGYEVYMIGSIRSIYYHLKAGVHVVCNMYAKTGKYRGDIIGELSANAIKIQLWHGVGIKAVGGLTNTSKKRTSRMFPRIVTRLKRTFNIYCFTPGLWGKMYFLATSEENKRISITDIGVIPERVIVANYPRENDNMRLTNKESQVIENIRKIRESGESIVLYLPTFRDGNIGNSKYINPTDIDGFLDYLHRNKIHWIEKRHQASSFISVKKNSINIMYLENDFDVNVIYRYADLLISDYSSAITDCVYRGIKTLNFIPDFEYYQSHDRGFTDEYSSYCPGYQVSDPCKLASTIVEALNQDYFSPDMSKRYKATREKLFEDNVADLGQITGEILEKIGF